MQSRIARRYAKALYALAKEQDCVDDVANDLTALRDQIDENKEMQQLVNNPTLEISDVRAAVNHVALALEASPLTQRFLHLLVENRRLEIIAYVLESYTQLVAKDKGELVARVISAVPLKVDQKKNVVSQLKKATGKGITIEEEIDEGILGGLIVYVGAHMIDHSLKGQLERLRLQQKQAALPA